MPRGFILQPSYRIEQDRPVVLLHGTLESGESFLARDRRVRPYFWIAAQDAHAARRLQAPVVDGPPERVDLAGRPMLRVVVGQPSAVPPLRDRLTAAGIACHEADVPFATRYLIDRGLRGAVELRGASRPGRGVAHVFDDPEILPGDWSPRLSVLSIDIETDPRAQRLLSVALCGAGADDVLLLTPRGYDCPADAVPCPDERSLLAALVERVQAIDPDVITGWNVIDFDLAVLERMGRTRRVPLRLGRGDEALRVRRSGLPRGPTRVFLPGRVVLDGIQLLRGAFVRVESYGLDAVSREILGRGKTIRGHDRADAILESFEHDRPRLVAYNRNDARLVLDILDRLRLVDLSVERSRLTGMPPDRVASSIAAFDSLYLGELGRRGAVAPSAHAGNGAEPTVTSGGHVLDPRPGLYRNVLVLDFRSLYPSVIRTFQIDPLGHVPRPSDGDDLIVAPSGAAFRREPGILPAMLDELFPRREAARAGGDAVASQAIKILMNSFYGVLGTTACRFADPALANAITSFGREILLWTKRRIESRGLEVLYGDTDSLFVHTAEADPGRARELGTRLVASINDDLRTWVDERWRVLSRLELEFERLYLRLFLPALRGGTGGARKRYAGLVERDGVPTVIFTGLEVVRRDWTRLARRVQRELYERLFSDRPVDDYLRDVVAELRAGRLDDLLVYRKSLRKRLDDYTASTPPHVAAARKMNSPPGRRIAYVITRDGPEPVSERRAPIDHEHYVQRQIRPVAEPVLARLGLDFDRVIGDASQLRLF